VAMVRMNSIRYESNCGTTGTMFRHLCLLLYLYNFSLR